MAGVDSENITPGDFSKMLDNMGIKNITPLER